MENFKNIIKKMVLEIDTNSMSSGLQIKDDIDGFLKEYIYPQLNEYFNATIPQNEIWRFEELQLEINLNSTESIKDSTPLFIAKIQPTIDAVKAGNIQESSPEIRIISTHKNKATVFFEFLKTGVLPWWSTEVEMATIAELQLVEPKVLKSSFKKIFNSSIALKRLIYQFDFLFISKLYALIYSEVKSVDSPVTPHSKNILSGALKDLFWMAVLPQKLVELPAVFEAIVLQHSYKTKKTLSNQLKVSKKMGVELMELLLFCNELLEIGIVLQPSKAKKKAIAFGLISNPKTALSDNRIFLETALKKGSHSSDIFPLEFDLSKAISEAKKEKKAGVISEENKAEISAKNSVETQHSKRGEIENPRPEEKDQKNQEDFNQTEEIDGMLLGNAGLVLLHPFLKHFFINLELISENKIIPSKAALAIHLLHYIATRNEQPAEHLLVFEKYLCNVPLNTPIDRFIKLTNQQKEACDELLEAVLKHWSGLRTNAIDALRSEFLMRAGKLSVKDDKHRLYIQRTTQDILLDTLPWNLHIVKLPWKEQMLYVEW